jgi:hypothetical protein
MCVVSSAVCLNTVQHSGRDDVVPTRLSSYNLAIVMKWLIV